eukprot:TRINITY_DN7291_c0_g1_i2.p1 TRINITY_DN7291_c0_g1~~TRINITY_DN7291_c0_g1_i2.p1  ORF type:complete len:101 (-),score=15.10 TRINITY_DN7291_c0_g1_i2:110-382(-)
MIHSQQPIYHKYQQHTFTLGTRSLVSFQQLRAVLGQFGFEGTKMVLGGLVLLGARHLGFNLFDLFCNTHDAQVNKNNCIKNYGLYAVYRR